MGNRRGLARGSSCKRDSATILLLLVCTRLPLANGQATCASGFCPESQKSPPDPNFASLVQSALGQVLGSPAVSGNVKNALTDDSLPGYFVVDVPGPRGDDADGGTRIIHWSSKDPIVLAHELYHVYQERTGTFNTTRLPTTVCDTPVITIPWLLNWLGKHDPGYIINPVVQGEAEAVQFENRFRACQGQTIRTCYGKWKLSHPLGLPPGINGCGDCIVDQSEECDSTAPGGKSCAFGPCGSDCKCPRSEVDCMRNGCTNLPSFDIIKELEYAPYNYGVGTVIYAGVCAVRQDFSDCDAVIPALPGSCLRWHTAGDYAIVDVNGVTVGYIQDWFWCTVTKLP